AGLVAITPAAGFVSPVGSIFIGLIAGALCCACTALKYKLGFDDSLDVVAVHLVGGVTGALLIGFLGTKEVNSVGLNGVFYGGGWHLMKLQILVVACAVGYSFLGTLIIGKVIDLTMGLRLKPDEEREGMDAILHAESAYDFGAAVGGKTLIGSGSVHAEALQPAAVPVLRPG